MIKFKQGVIEYKGVITDIIVEAVSPNKIKDVLIGGGIILVGINWLTNKAFKNGAKAFEYAEYKAMSKAGVIKHEEKLDK